MKVKTNQNESRERELRIMVLLGQSRGGCDQKGAKVTFRGGEYVLPLGSGHSSVFICKMLSSRTL